MALTQISTQGIKDGTITGSDLATNVDLVDNQKIRFGTGNDLQIYFDGTNSFIKEPNVVAGQLVIDGYNGTDIRRGATGDHIIRAIGGGSVELYHNGSKKFETTSTGATVHHSNFCTLEIRANSNDAVLRLTSHNNDNTDWAIQNDQSESNILDFRFNNTSKMYLTSDGSLHIVGNLDLEDNDKLKLGAGDDLQIFHDGSHSYIDDTGTGNLYIQSNHVNIDSKNGEQFINCIQDGAVELYHDNSKKFETTSAGVSIAGNLDFPDNTSGNASLRFGNSQDFFMNHNGTDSFIINNTGNLYIRDLNGDVHIQGKDNEEGIIVKADEGVELYYNNGKRFEITSSGAKISSTAATLRLHSTTDQQTATIEMTSSNNESQIGSIKYNHANSGIVSGYLEAFLIDGTETNLAVKVDGAIKIPDSGTKDAKLLIGAGDDLKIFHDGTNSAINNTTNDLRIESDRIELNNQASNEFYLTCTANGAVELYHNNIKKFETASTGLLFPNTGTLSQNAIYFEAGANTNEYSTMFGVTNYPDASDFGDQNDGFWAKIKSRGGCVVIINSDGNRNDGRNTYDHFSVYHREGESTNGKRAFSVDHVGGVQFGQAGINIDREWGNQPSFSMTRDCNDGTNNTDDNAYFRFHGTAKTHSSWTGGGSGNDFSANMLLDGGNYNASDRRAKTDIVDCPYGLAEVLKLRPRKYQLVNSQLEPQGDDNINLGFIAQELMEILPEPVNYLKNEDVPNEKGFCRAYILDMNEVVPVLTKAIQELAAKVAVLENEVATLKAS